VSDYVIFDNVTFSYGKNKVLEDITFSVSTGDFTALIGPNGGGKTTILRLMLGLIVPEKGKVRVCGIDPSKKILKTGYVPQFSVHDRNFPMEVKDVVMQGLLESSSLGPFYSKEVKKKTENILEKLGLAEKSKERFGSLSGGMKQRALIARAMVSEPELLLLDEPVSSVDSKVEKDIFEMLKEFNKKTTIVIVSHDIGFISGFVNRIACVNRKLVTHDPKDITIRNIDDIYKSTQLAINHECGI
jgi:zinc transport system ATP-binding protein